MPHKIFTKSLYFIKFVLHFSDFWPGELRLKLKAK